MDIRDELMARGHELMWHPAYMRARYENWVNGLNGAWCVGRQRFRRSVSRLVRSGRRDHRLRRPAAAGQTALPIDPSSDAPAGFREDQRGVPVDSSAIPT